MIVNLPKSWSHLTALVLASTVLLLFTAIYLMVTILYHSETKDYFSIALSILSIMGTVVTALGFVAGLFFILLAVDTYTEVQKIKEFRESAFKLREEAKQTFSKLHRENEKMLRELADSMDYFLSTQLAVAASPQSQDKRRRRISQARREFALRSKYLSETRRISLIQEFKNIGTEKDIDALQEVLDDPTESEKIKEVVGEVISVLREKTED